MYSNINLLRTALLALWLVPRSVRTFTENQTEPALRVVPSEAVDTVPGVSGTRFMVLNNSKPYEDNKDCLTGQDPFNSTEVELARKYWNSQREAIVEATPPNSIVVMLPGFTLDRMQNGIKNCLSGICSYDFERFSYVCGRLLEVSYPDGKSCLDGTPAHSDIEKRKSLELQPEPQEQYNGKANQLFGQRCKSKKCYYHYHKDAFLCAASSLRPNNDFLFFLLGIFVINTLFE